MSSPFKGFRTNGTPPRPPAPKQYSTLGDISEADWPAERDAIVQRSAGRELGTMPAHHVASPILVPGPPGPDGQPQHILHFGIRRRELIAKDLLCAAIGARIVQPGVIGNMHAVPVTPEERARLITDTFQLADMFVKACQQAEQQDLDTVRQQLADKLDEQYAAAKAPKGSIITKVLEQ